VLFGFSSVLAWFQSFLSGFWLLLRFLKNAVFFSFAFVFLRD
jgi:hypothetical protein